jgi:hypothetical protein
MNFQTTDHIEYMPRSRIQAFLGEKEPEQKLSPKLTKSLGKQKAQQKQLQLQAQATLPPSPVNGYGVTDAVFRFFEVCINLRRLALY